MTERFLVKQNFELCNLTLTQITSLTCSKNWFKLRTVLDFTRLWDETIVQRQKRSINTTSATKSMLSFSSLTLFEPFHRKYLTHICYVLSTILHMVYWLFLTASYFYSTTKIISNALLYIIVLLETVLKNLDTYIHSGGWLPHKIQLPLLEIVIRS